MSLWCACRPLADGLEVAAALSALLPPGRQSVAQQLLAAHHPPPLPEAATLPQSVPAETVRLWELLQQPGAFCQHSFANSINRGCLGACPLSRMVGGQC